VKGKYVGLRARKKQRMREQIIKAAFQLFERKGFEAVTVEEIAATIEISPRTFYRYFPTKEDVVLLRPDDSTVVRAMQQREPEETDVEFVARVMKAAIADRKADNEAKMYRLIERTPALQAHLFQVTWEDQDVLAQELLRRSSRKAGDEFRARIVAHTVTNAIRIAYVDWMRSGQQGSAWNQCEKALAILREAFGATPKKNRSTEGPKIGA
jgi:AcrR family transcriptional regulator